jgi:uncharacterized cupredoxin-like copper-binding protein
MKTWQRFGSVVALGTLVGLGLGAQGVTAKDPTANHPAYIHADSCARLGGIAYPLTNVSLTGLMAGMNGMMGTPGAGMMMGSPSAGMGGMMGSAGVGMSGMMGTPGAAMTLGPRQGAPTALPVETSLTVVNTTLPHLLSEPHAINVAASQADIQRSIACGDLGGQVMTGPGMMQGGVLVVGLQELNGSGASGIAILVGQDDQTQVWLSLTETQEVAGTAGGLATPMSGTLRAAGATQPITVPVALVEMTITPAQTTFKVGQPYTFVVTNNGATEHEMVIERRGADDQALQANGQEAEAADLDPGQTKTLTWTFTEPGAYQLACHVPGHYEAGMVTAITVTP